MVTKKVIRKSQELRLDVRSEFRKQVVTGITAAFAFLIALVWREPIEGAVRGMMASLGLDGTGFWHKILTAILVTIVAALVLVILSRWAAKKE